MEEQKAARTAVGMIDYSMMGKIMVEGKDAQAFLQRVCSNNININIGRVIYTLMLNDRGGIESDITIARYDDNRYMVMSSISRTRRDFLHLREHILADEEVRLGDVTTNYGVLAVMGPKSRELLAIVCDVDLSNEAFRFNSLEQMHIGHAKVTAQRLSFTGELGWEIFVTPDFAEHVFAVLFEQGQKFGLRLIGGEALNALRIEKGFLHWGHDMAYTEAPHQMGLEFICKTNKPQPFIGRDAYQARRLENKGPFLCSLKLNDPQPLLHHNEPVMFDGKVVGYVTSGAYSYSMGSAVGLCLLNLADEDNAKLSLEKEGYTVMVEGEAVEASISLTPFYDAKNERMFS